MHLKEYLKNTGIKATFLAEKSNVTRRTIWNILQDKPVCQDVAESIRKITGPIVQITVSEKGKGKTGRRKKTHEKDN